MDDGFLGNYTKFGRICLDDFKLDGPHAAADKEGIALANGTVGWWMDISFEEW
jgi:hypothetical protein